MAGCCGGGVATKITEGTHIDVSGSGTSQDPYVITADVGLAVTDNTTFDLTLTGSGTVASPWNLAVAFAATAKLDDLPDVNASTPTNTQVLSWDSATSRWIPRAPTTAASGSISHGNGLTGDGSGGSPLNLVTDPARFGVVGAPGWGLSDAGINSLIRHFTDAVARVSASPVPVLNSLSILDSLPGRVQYWDGTQWNDVVGPRDQSVVGGEFLALSGSYSGQRLTEIIKNLSFTTDSSGNFDLLTSVAGELSGHIGVLTCRVMEVMATSGGVPWKAVLWPNTDRISGTAYRLDDGTAYASQALLGLVTALVYG